MSLMEKKKVTAVPGEKRALPGGIFCLCDGCGATLQTSDLDRSYRVCPACRHHHPLAAKRWVELLLDEDSFDEHDATLRAADPLGFVDQKPYFERVEAAIEKSGANDAILSGTGKLEGREVELVVFRFEFLGGSMGSVVGEKITRAVERARVHRRPLIILAASGGARMQEGSLSLMQMAKTVSELRLLHEANVPFISILRNPTTGGVAASFAFLGDVNLAEPGALIGFAGPRVIEQTIREKLPEGFQRSEFLLEHGMLDEIVPRGELRSRLALILSHLLD
jgi:acetyl-CoA carboxylase carboxyl transferase subunit beta